MEKMTNRILHQKVERLQKGHPLDNRMYSTILFSKKVLEKNRIRNLSPRCTSPLKGTALVMERV